MLEWQNGQMEKTLKLDYSKAYSWVFCDGPVDKILKWELNINTVRLLWSWLNTQECWVSIILQITLQQEDDRSQSSFIPKFLKIFMKDKTIWHIYQIYTLKISERVINTLNDRIQRDFNKLLRQMKMTVKFMKNKN